MRSFLLLVLLLSLAKPQPIFAKSKLKTQAHRRFDRSTVKLVRVVFSAKRLTLYWKAPSGREIAYHARRTPPGVRIKLKRYLDQGHTRVAVGGAYQMLNGKSGQVEPEFAYRAHRVWRGVKAVKFDGWMPLFNVTRLPTPQHKEPMIFELRGIISTAMADRDNKLVCVYGTWFELADYIHPRTKRRRGMVYQVEGIKGPSLFFFPKVYKHPRSWHHILDYKEKMIAFREAQRRRQQGLPPYDRTIRIPLVSQQNIKAFNKRCQSYLSPLDKKLSYGPIVLSQPKPKARATKTAAGKAPTARKAAVTAHKAAIAAHKAAVRAAAPAPTVRKATSSPATTRPAPRR